MSKQRFLASGAIFFLVLVAAAGNISAREQVTDQVTDTECEEQDANWAEDNRTEQEEDKGAQSDWENTDWGKVDEAMGRAGTVEADNVHKYLFPRTDLQLSIRDVPVKAVGALGTHVAMMDADDGAIYMADLALTEEEVNPVISELQKNNVSIAAIHKHTIGENPRMMFVHLMGKGDAVEVARAIRGALEKSATPKEAPEAGPDKADLGLDTGRFDEIMGREGKAMAGAYEYEIPRTEEVRDQGQRLSPLLGIHTVIDFFPLPNDEAAVAGDFVLRADEVNPVIQFLREKGFEVAALHNHGLTEEPRLFYLHFFKKGNAVEAAQDIRTALDKTHSVK